MKRVKSIYLFLIITSSFFSFEKTNCMQRKNFFVIAGLIGFSYLTYKIISKQFFKDLNIRANGVVDNCDQQELKDFHEAYPLANQIEPEVKISQEMVAGYEAKAQQEVLLERTPTLFDIKECNSKLIRAIKVDDYEAVKFWLNKGSKVTIGAILEALKNNIKIFKLFIDRMGKDLPQELKNAYLQYAVQIEKNADLAMSLINANADVNMVDCQGRTLLHLAILEGDSETVEILIKKGVDLSVQYKKKFFFKKNKTLFLFEYLGHSLNSKNELKRIFAEKCIKCINKALGTCAICLDENLHDNHRTNCGHIFHKHCFNRWLESSFTCPTCRCPLAPLLI